MVSNTVYEALKSRKGDRSFSETILDVLGVKASTPAVKTGEGLRKFLGVLKDDTEYDEIMRYSRKKWKDWEENFYKGKGESA